MMIKHIALAVFIFLTLSLYGQENKPYIFSPNFEDNAEYILEQTERSYFIIDNNPTNRGEETLDIIRGVLRKEKSDNKSVYYSFRLLESKLAPISDGLSNFPERFYQKGLVYKFRTDRDGRFMEITNQLEIKSKIQAKLSKDSIKYYTKLCNRYKQHTKSAYLKIKKDPAKGFSNIEKLLTNYFRIYGEEYSVKEKTIQKLYENYPHFSPEALPFNAKTSIFENSDATFTISTENVLDKSKISDANYHKLASSTFAFGYDIDAFKTNYFTSFKEKSVVDKKNHLLLVDELNLKNQYLPYSHYYFERTIKLSH